MSLVSLTASNFRCLEHIDLEFDPRCTAIAGSNGAGKTSLLEAIYVLSVGRSFRTNRPELLIGRSQPPEFLIVGKVVVSSRRRTLGVRWSREEKEIHLDGAHRRGFADLTAALPVQVIDPNSHTLVEGGPIERRRYVDWGVFHVEQAFWKAWKDYSKALQQRNAALKSQQPVHLVRSWDEQLISAGESVGRYRRAYVDTIASTVAANVSELLGLDASLSVKDGWMEGKTFEESVESNWVKDIRFRTTTVGPHRADLELRVGSDLAKDVVSRGQQKVLACALILAQLQHRVAAGLEPACLLLDDPAAELDVNNLGKLLQLVGRIPAQLVATAVDFRTVELLSPGKMFHVKQGEVT